MIMDLLTVLILITSAIHYARKGFIRTLLGAVQWIAGVVLGLLFCGNVCTWLDAHTRIGASMRDYFATRFAENTESQDLLSSLPNTLRGELQAVQNQAADAMADELTHTILMILSFVLILLAIKLFCGLISLLFSKKHHHGAIGLTDGVVGFVTGIVIGCLLVLIGFALLIPALNWMPEPLATKILLSLDHSFVSGTLYYENPLLKWLEYVPALLVLGIGGLSSTLQQKM